MVGEHPKLNPGQATLLLLAWRNGDEGALPRLTQLLYQELHQIARRYMRAERPGATLQPTALLNELYLRLIDVQHVAWNDRAHFVAVAANLMRRILIDAARARRSLKRGGELWRTSIGAAMALPNVPKPDVLDLDAALETLEKTDPRKAKVVELRYFGGLTVEETAEALGIAEKTVQLDWRAAKGLLAHHLSRSSAAAHSPGG